MMLFASHYLLTSVGCTSPLRLPAAAAPGGHNGPGAPTVSHTLSGRRVLQPDWAVNHSRQDEAAELIAHSASQETLQICRTENSRQHCRSISHFTISRCGKTGLKRWKKSTEWFLSLCSCCRIHISPLFSLWWTNNFNEPRFKTFN